MAELASLAELELHLNMVDPPPSDEAELYRKLEAARALVVSIVGDMSAETVTETVDIINGTAILSRPPTGPVLVDGVDIGGRVNAAAGLVTHLSWSSYSLTVTYPAGDNGVSALLDEATLIIAAHLWETQRGAQPLPMMGGSDLSEITPGSGFLLPNRAKELLLTANPFVTIA